MSVRSRIVAAAIVALGDAGAAAGAPATYVLDPAHSFVHFEIVHFGTSTTRGRFGPVAGEVVLDRAAGRGEVALRIAARSVDTGLRVFDVRLCEDDLLACEAYPEAFFVARQFRFEGDDLAEVRGEFTWRGVGRALSLHTRVFGCRRDADLDREVCGGDFEGEIRRSEFGATFGLPFVADLVRLRVQVEGVRRR